jgi:hypothetical protein
MVTKATTKAGAVRDVFEEAWKVAKGRYSTVTARQVYYKVRELVNLRYKDQWGNRMQLEVDVRGRPVDGQAGKKTDYQKVFVREFVTEMFETGTKNVSGEEYEETIVLERRGTFTDPFFKNSEKSLDTETVRGVIGEEHENKISQETQTKYDLDPELRYSQVLFVEKQGYQTPFDESGLLGRLNLGLIAGQGFGSRAMKQLAQHFRDRGMPVYILHDCDAHGYDIFDTFLNGNKTYKEPIDVIDIGLTVNDARRLGKAPEEVTKETDWSKMLGEICTPEEAAWLMPPNKNPAPGVKRKKGQRYMYQRVELNALTNDELIAFVESKIDPRPIEPRAEVIKQAIGINSDVIYKDVLAETVEKYRERLEGCMLEIDYEKIAIRLHEYEENGNHWAIALNAAVKDYLESYKRKSSDAMKHVLQDASFSWYIVVDEDEKKEDWEE